MSTDGNTARTGLGFIGFPQNRLARFAMGLLVAVMGVVTAYYTTIGDIQVNLADKAEESAVAQIDKRLAAIEATLNEKFITREEFYRFREEVRSSLIRIEYQTRDLRGSTQSSEGDGT